MQSNFIDVNNADVFFHSWWDESLVGTPFDSTQPLQTGKVGVWANDTLPILNSIGAKKYLIEKPRTFPEASGFRSSPTANQHSMCSVFYSQWKAGELKREYENEHKFVYDIVVRTRLDMVFNSKVSVTDLKIKPGTLILASKWQDIRQVFIPGLGSYTMDDNFVVGDSATVDKYLSVFPRMKELNDKIWPPFAENYLGCNCKIDQGILTETKNFDIEISHRII